jgi:hypothetical protein
MAIREMPYETTRRIQQAEYRATLVLPPATAKMVKRELKAWREFGTSIGGETLLTPVVDEILELSGVKPSSH